MSGGDGRAKGKEVERTGGMRVRAERGVGNLRAKEEEERRRQYLILRRESIKKKRKKDIKKGFIIMSAARTM